MAFFGKKYFFYILNIGGVEMLFYGVETLEVKKKPPMLMLFYSFKLKIPYYSFTFLIKLFLNYFSFFNYFIII